MRNFALSRLNRGLNIVSPVAKMNPRQLAKAENCVYTRDSLKRRRGRLASHIRVSTTAAVSMLKRFYRLATTGTISRYFLTAFGTSLYKADTDWSDDTRTLVNGLTEIPKPQTGNNSLYDQHETNAHTLTAGALKASFSSKNWLYAIPQYDSTDDLDAAYPKNAPIRTDGTKAYLMGLVPPATLALADTEGTDLPLPADFQWEGIDAAIGAALYTNVSFNADGDVAIVYVDSTTSNVKVAIRNGGVWSVSSPYPASTAGFSTGRIDANGVVHLAFYNTTGAANELVYANNSSGSFPATTTVDTTGDVGNYCQLVLDASGNVHIAYYDTTNTALKYATDSGGAFSTETVDDSASVGTQIDIALDSSGIPHVSYVDATNADILYAKRVSDGTNQWTTEIAVAVVAAHTVGNHTSIAITSEDEPGITFGDTINGDLYYVSRSTGSWGTPELVESSLNYDQASLVYDSEDIPFIMYHEATTTSAYFATSTATEGGTWSKSSNLAIQKGWQDLVYDPDTDSFYVAVDRLGLKFEQLFRHRYHYRLTAEYDNAVLGESGPSAALKVTLWRQTGDAIGEKNTHTLLLNSGSGIYDMTDDVTRIFVYRTLRSGASDATYFRAGSVDCTAGTAGQPDSDFVDDVSDTDLVGNRILDEDRYLPPKFQTGVFWKDRAVIANLKARRTDAAEGTELDLEANGIHKNRVRFSEAFHPDVYRANFFQDILPDGDSGSIQQLVVNPRDDSLYVLMENDVVALTDLVGDTVSALSAIPRNVANSHGSPSRFSAVEHEGFVFYVTKWGIEVIDGSAARDITSDTMGPLWNLQDSAHPYYAHRINMAQLGLIRGAVHVDSDGERILWTYPAATSAFCNRVLVLDFARWRESGFRDDGVFSVFTGWAVSCFASQDGEGDRGEFFGGEADGTKGSWAYRLELSNVDEQGDSFAAVSTTAIPAMVVKPGLTDAGTEERLKRFRTVRVNGKIASVANTGACSVAIKADISDGEATPTLDTVTWGQGGVRHVSKNFPHTAIAMYAGVEITATDQTPGASGGSPPFELLSISYTVNDMAAMTVRG